MPNGQIESTPTPDLNRLYQRILEKKQDYQSYDFTRKQNDLLKTFFDLSQEFLSLPDFYRISVVAPKVFLGVDVRLYLLGEEDSGHELMMVCDSVEGYDSLHPPAPSHVRLTDEPHSLNGSWFVPITRKAQSSEGLVGESLEIRKMGVLEIFPSEALLASDLFFFNKYANRIAYKLHNRRLVQQNIRHLKFINSLVVDIEHNVIIPNMYFLHLFNGMRKNIKALDEILGELTASGGGTECETTRERLADLHRQMADNHRHLLDHHATTSLFLESLLRREHFKQGHLVLKARPCQVEDEIILPQLENYLNRMSRNGITVEFPGDMDEETVPLSVDIGLLSQVYANLFSNAVKYTEVILTREGRPRKVMAFGRTFMGNFFGPGRDGIKFNVFTTGPHIASEELGLIFQDGRRGSNCGDKSGSGHGLSFIKQVIEIHGGVVGCETTEEGNNFYFILPLPHPWEDLEKRNLS
ncbi:MAG: HAMP domain-containing histidine kinase [Proteobacteria bacterium]|nr:HAMP domain-containing histidine kinase [Pseudomonadota bacterium]MBU1686712.1 HAMP domain-containing histidine kinase [Pseudomonadota bacterium]